MSEWLWTLASILCGELWRSRDKTGPLPPGGHICSSFTNDCSWNWWGSSNLALKTLKHNLRRKILFFSGDGHSPLPDSIPDDQGDFVCCPSVFGTIGRRVGLQAVLLFLWFFLPENGYFVPSFKLLSFTSGCSGDSWTTLLLALKTPKHNVRRKIVFFSDVIILTVQAVDLKEVFSQFKLLW